LRALHPRKKPLAVLPGDIDMNPANFVGNKLRTDGHIKPSKIPIYKGAKLYLTQNRDKGNDYVNGMGCVVEDCDPAGRWLRVRTNTNHRLMITKITDVEHDRAVYFPIRLGYASNVHKVQGAQFDHITIWLDMPNMPAAGYTALSRVKYATNYLIGGRMTPEHFVPAVEKYKHR